MDVISKSRPTKWKSRTLKSFISVPLALIHDLGFHGHLGTGWITTQILAQMLVACYCPCQKGNMHFGTWVRSLWPGSKLLHSNPLTWTPFGEHMAFPNGCKPPLIKIWTVFNFTTRFKLYHIACLLSLILKPFECADFCSKLSVKV